VLLSVKQDAVLPQPTPSLTCQEPPARDMQQIMLLEC
jgi:hypothetical protein